MTTKQREAEIVGLLYELAADGITNESQREWRQNLAGEIQRYITDPAAIAQLMWIECSKRMPPCEIDISGDHPHLAKALKTDLVMCWFGSDRPSIGYFMQVIREQWDARSETWFESEAEGSIDIEDVTHWMPLPAPPTQTQSAGDEVV